MNASVNVRHATPDDYHAYLALLPELGSNAPALARDRWLTEIMPTALMAFGPRGVVGYLYYQPLFCVGYIRHVITAPHARRQGVARALMHAAADALRARGCSRWELNVLPTSLPATSLYKSLGMGPMYASTALRFSWADVERLPHVSGLSVRPIQAADDARLEAQFMLLNGQLPDLRVGDGRMLLRVDEQGACVGLAMFDPGFPGAFPFRVKPHAARALLEAMHPHAQRDKAHLSLVAEDDLALRQALIDAGGIVKLDLEHYGGTLPAPC